MNETQLYCCARADSTGAAGKMPQYPRHNRPGKKYYFDFWPRYYFAPGTIVTFLPYTKMVKRFHN